MRTSLPSFLAALALAVAASCASTPSSPAADEGAEAYVPIQPQADEPIGKFLADVDLSMRYWTNLKLSARSEEDRRKARELESIVGIASTRRLEELLVELQSGPPRNRQRAATALGFTHDRRALGPLLAALDDADPDVVHNALLGLTLLGFPDTPTLRIV